MRLRVMFFIYSIKKHVRFRFFFFFFFSLQNIVNNSKIFKALFIDRARIYFLRVIYDDFSSFKCHILSHVPLYLFTFYLYRSVCRTFGHRGQYDTVRCCEFFLLISRVRTVDLNGARLAPTKNTNKQGRSGFRLTNSSTRNLFFSIGACIDIV